MALEAIDEVDAQLREADRLRTEAVDCLHRNQPGPAMEKLSGCFSTWNNAQESVCKTAQLLRIDLDRVRVGDRTLTQLLTHFGDQLREIKDALEGRDFVTLADILAYEATQTSTHWQHALAAIRRIIEDSTALFRLGGERVARTVVSPSSRPIIQGVIPTRHPDPSFRTSFARRNPG